MVSENDVLEILKGVDDPEIGISIVDMGLVENIKINNENIDVELILTTPFCPMADIIVSSAKQAIENTKKFKKVKVNLNLDKKWLPERLSDEAKKKLGFV